MDIEFCAINAITEQTQASSWHHQYVWEIAVIHVTQEPIPPMTFQMTFSREEVISQKERSPGEQLIAVNNADQGELGPGILSQWPVDNTGVGALKGKRHVAEQQEPGEQLGSLAWRKEVQGRQEAIISTLRRINKADLEFSGEQN